MTAAPAPTRATNNITIVMGLMRLNVQLFKATEAIKPVERSSFTGDLCPIGVKKYNKTTGAILVGDSDVHFMVDMGDALIELTDDEIATATAGAAVDKGAVEITTFIPLDALGSTYKVDTDRLYQVRPTPREVGSGKKKRKEADPLNEKIYTLLMQAMAAKNAGTLVRVGLRGQARYAVLTPNGEMQFLFFPGELREALPLPDVDVTDGEVDAFGTYIDTVGYDTPELVDDAKAAIYAYLALKADNKVPVAAAPIVEPEATILDLTAALEASIAAVKEAKAA